jgi:glycosyltransferase involved in cell wall biosynthesis
MKSNRIGIIHYSAPPVIGGVEAVIEAHAKLFYQKGYSTSVIAGRGDLEALVPVNYIALPMVDSQNPEILRLSSELEVGCVPEDFNTVVNTLVEQLAIRLNQIDNLIVHNIFTKHFNLPLTVALIYLIDKGLIRQTIAWCHDMTWTSPSSRSKVFPGYPWDLLRTQHPEVTYVAVSERRQRELAGLFNCPSDQIEVIYNGVNPSELLGLSSDGLELISRLNLLESDLNLLMPVRVTQAKNIEYAMSVLAALKPHYRTPKLVLTGPPDPHDSENIRYFQSLLDLRKDLGIEDEMRFVYESGDDPDRPYEIDSRVVGDLYRVSDVMFMPSHREGFGMPVLEAGLAGIPVISTNVPASQEIAKENIMIFEASQPPQKTAEQIHNLVEKNSLVRMRRLIRTQYTWEAIFANKIKPLLG